LVRSKAPGGLKKSREGLFGSKNQIWVETAVRSRVVADRWAMAVNDSAALAQADV